MIWRRTLPRCRGVQEAVLRLARCPRTGLCGAVHEARYRVLPPRKGGVQRAPSPKYGPSTQGRVDPLTSKKPLNSCSYAARVQTPANCADLIGASSRPDSASWKLIRRLYYSVRNRGARLCVGSRSQFTRPWTGQETLCDVVAATEGVHASIKPVLTLGGALATAPRLFQRPSFAGWHALMPVPLPLSRVNGPYQHQCAATRPGAADRLRAAPPMCSFGRARCAALLCPTLGPPAPRNASQKPARCLSAAWTWALRRRASRWRASGKPPAMGA